MDLPEHEKLKAIAPLSQAVSDFLDWLQEEKKVSLAAYAENDKSDRLYFFNYNKSELLAEHFDIDLKALEKEKEALLTLQRELNDKTN